VRIKSHHHALTLSIAQLARSASARVRVPTRSTHATATATRAHRGAPSSSCSPCQPTNARSDVTTCVVWRSSILFHDACEQVDFSVRDLVKQARKPKSGKRSRDTDDAGADGDDHRAPRGGDAFVIDSADPRFADVFTEPAFAIDPTYTPLLTLMWRV
jgi:hypothetical protein